MRLITGKLARLALRRGHDAGGTEPDDPVIDDVLITRNRFGSGLLEGVDIAGYTGTGATSSPPTGSAGSVRGLPVRIRESEDVARAADRQDRVCVETLLRFCALLGAAAGDIALMLGATGGVYIAGGMAPRLLAWLERSEFRLRYEVNGRLSPIVQKIPTQVITHPHPALLGAARAIGSAVSREA